METIDYKNYKVKLQKSQKAEKGEQINFQNFFFYKKGYWHYLQHS